MDEGEKSGSGFLVTCGNGPKALESVKETLDEVTAAIELAVDARLSFADGSGADDGLHSFRLYRRDDSVGVVAGISDN